MDSSESNSRKKKDGVNLFFLILSNIVVAFGTLSFLDHNGMTKSFRIILKIYLANYNSH